MSQHVILLLFLLGFMINYTTSTTRHLRLIHINDIYQVNPLRSTGGFSRVKSVIEQQRLEAKSKGMESLLLFGGDLQPASLGEQIVSLTDMIHFIEKFNIDYATLGNHEFGILPLDELRSKIRDTNIHWITTNLMWRENDTTEPFGHSFYRNFHLNFDPDTSSTVLSSSIIDNTPSHRPIRVGMIGLLTETTLKEDVSMSEHPNFSLENVISSAKEAVRILIEKYQVDFIIAITHLDLKKDIELARAVASEQLFVFGGHDHFPVSTLEGSTLIMKSGMNAQYVVVCDLEIRFDSKGKVRVFPSWKYISVNDAVEPDPEYEEFVQDFAQKNKNDADQILGVTKTFMDSRETSVRRRETSMTNMVADAVCNFTQADFALITGGSVRGDRLYPRNSTITKAHILSELPFHNHVVKVRIAGSEIFKVLEHALATVDQGSSGRFPHVSGLQLQYNPQSPPYSRIISLTDSEGMPVEPNKVYSLGTVDFLIHGGDGFPFQHRSLVNKGNERRLVSEVVIRYIIENGGIIEPRVQGRVQEVYNQRNHYQKIPQFGTSHENSIALGV